jgi:hypothetical protein
MCNLFSFQICHEFERFSTYLPDLKVAVFYGGVNIKVHKDLLKNECPQIVVGTPGRILALAREKNLSLMNVRHFVLDECDKMLESLGMCCISVKLNIAAGFSYVLHGLYYSYNTFCRHEERRSRHFQVDSP